MSQITDKRALCIGIDYMLMEAQYDYAVAKAFLEQPGPDWWLQNGNIVIPDSRYRFAAYSAIEPKERITPFEVRGGVYPYAPLESLREDIIWAYAGKLRYLYLTLHGFEVVIVLPNGKKIVIRGLYMGHDGTQGYPYSFDYMSKHLFCYFDVIIIDACFAGGAKHPGRYEIPSAMAAQNTAGMEPQPKAFTLDQDECIPAWLVEEPTDLKKQTIIVASKQTKPAWGALLGGPGRYSPYHTDYNSLFTSCLFTASARQLSGAPGYINTRKTGKIVNTTDGFMNIAQKIWDMPVSPCSFSGPNRILFEE